MITLESKVYYLHGPNNLVLESQSIVIPDDNEKYIYAETRYTAISPGTETAAFNGLEPLRPGKIYPRVLGYCNVAQVIEVGKQVSKIVPGDYILTFQSHRSNFIIDESAFFLKLPSTKDVSKFSTSYLFHLGYHALITAENREGNSIGIIGSGVLAYTTAKMNQLCGGKSYIFSNQENISCFFKNTDSIIIHGEDYNLRKLSDSTLCDGVDIVVNTANSWNHWRLALEIVKVSGTIVNLGFPGRGDGLPSFNPLDPTYTYFKHLTIKSLILLVEKASNEYKLKYTIEDNLNYIFNKIEKGEINPSEIFSDEINSFELNKQYLEYSDRKKHMFSTLIHW
jgi:threonine dehydrogenase-like Zn-dependent dehydrogenase